jgi:probable rRNA maturation factor
MSVFVQKQGGKAEGVTAGAVRERAALMLAELDLGGAELSVLLTSDRSIHRLNREFRSKDKPTDVLAFAMREGEVMGGQPGHEGEMLGDVVISLDTATRQAAERKRSPLEEVTHLLAHGLLHLVGYDHQTDEEEREMNEATRALVKIATAAPKETAKKAPVKRAPSRGASKR